MAYIIPGIPGHDGTPPPPPLAQPLYAPARIAAILSATPATRQQQVAALGRRARVQAEQQAWRALDDAAEAIRRVCLDTHPPQHGGSCGCYLDAPATHAMMAWQSNFCNLCGGEGICHPACEAIDARH